ncbi:hypothetical protein, partial [Methylacidimicrobium tartarophylax]|uniref:hypothetical protein n=1 Tax=Methylacidimicrobium tartarophylax TaxID=1041768 RepID=UPI001C49A52F
KASASSDPPSQIAQPCPLLPYSRGKGKVRQAVKANLPFSTEQAWAALQTIHLVEFAFEREKRSQGHRRESSSPANPLYLTYLCPAAVADSKRAKIGTVVPMGNAIYCIATTYDAFPQT